LWAEYEKEERRGQKTYERQILRGE